MTTAELPQPIAPNAVASTSARDFPEWLSPILVKELRQCMRSRRFVISFLLLHAALIVVAVIALLVATGQGDTSIASGFFWTIIGALLLVVMPISGLGSVANERKANSLELIFLTRVTPRRILVGKWLAIVAQTVLLVCLALPYLVLRYFLGGIDVTRDLTTLALLMLGSALLSGVAVGLSPQLSRITRALLIIGAVFFLQVGWPLLLYGRTRGGSVVGGGAASWTTQLGIGLLAVLLLLMMFELGASKIAPVVANHSTSRRLIGLAAILIVGVLGGINVANTALLPAAIVLLVPICVGALCEMPSALPAVYRPFVRRGLAGRLAGRFLYPGWPSGVLYTLLVLALFFVPAYFAVRGVVEPLWIWWIGMTIAGALLLPAAVNYTFLARFRRPLIVYISVQILCALLTAFAGIVYALSGGDFRAFVAIIPTCGLLLSQSGAVHDTNLPLVLIGTSIVTFGSIALLLLKSRTAWRGIRAAETAASALTATRFPDAPEPRPAH